MPEAPRCHSGLDTENRDENSDGGKGVVIKMVNYVNEFMNCPELPGGGLNLQFSEYIWRLSFGKGNYRCKKRFSIFFEIVVFLVSMTHGIFHGD